MRLRMVSMASVTALFLGRFSIDSLVAMIQVFSRARH